MSGERFSAIPEIKDELVEYDKNDKTQGSGPILYSDGLMTYFNNSEDHAEIVGRTGEGKSEGVVLSAVRMAIEKGESLIVTDPKGDIYSRCGGAVSKEYITVVLNFRSPSQSPDCYNPLSTISKLSRSSDIQDRDLGESMLSELSAAIYPLPRNDDPFWALSARTFLQGVVGALLEKADPEEINMRSVAEIIEQADTSAGMPSTSGNKYISILQSSLDSSSLAYRRLSPYIGAPNETKGSIYTVATQGVEIFSRSEGLALMLGSDTVNFMDWDYEKPFAVFIILPDETNVYSPIAGIFISQLTQYLIKKASDLGGRLPIKTNIVLEELGSMGGCIPNLPHLAVASRSRNIRLYLILQAHEQLNEIYGKDMAETIFSSCGISINFANNDINTLNLLSQRCGMKESFDKHGRPIQQPLISAAELGSLPRFNAMIFSRNLKYVTRLPMYNEIFDALPEPLAKEDHPERETRIFDLKQFVQEQKERNMKKISELLGAIDIDKEEKEKKEKIEKEMRKNSVKKNTGSNSHIMLTNTKTLCGKKYTLYVTANVRSRENVAKLIAEKKKISKRKAAIKIYDHQPVKLSFDNEMERFLFSKLVLLAGGNCTTNE